MMTLHAARAVVSVVAAWGVLASCASGEEAGKPAPTVDLAGAVAATKAKATGAFEVTAGRLPEEYSVTGAYDLSRRVHHATLNTSFGTYPNEEKLAVRRRIAADDVYFQFDRRAGKPCWLRPLGLDDFDDGTPEVVRLLDSLRAGKTTSQDGAVSATSTSGVVGDLLFGLLDKKPKSRDRAARSVPVPVTVLIGQGVVKEVRLNVNDLVTSLETVGADTDDLFGAGIDNGYAATLRKATVALTDLGRPVKVERPSAAETCRS